MTKTSLQSGEQYFTATPTVSAHPKELQVELAGMPFRVHTASGVFCGSGLDKGTEVLLRKAPQLPANGTFVDVGCGWGPLTLVMARLRPQARVIGVDVNTRALELTARNAQDNGLTNVEVFNQSQAFTQIKPQSVDLIWSNPPIRVGKEKLHQIWQAWQQKLHPNGEAYLVMGKNLGADTFTSWARSNGWYAEKIASSKGFRLLHLTVLQTLPRKLTQN